MFQTIARRKGFFGEPFLSLFVQIGGIRPFLLLPGVLAQPVEVKAKKNPMLGKTVVTVKTKLKHLNGNNVRMSDLPEFAGEKWRARFLPTLYDKFFSSNKPFDAFYLGNDTFVTVLQAIVEEVYPEVKYKVTSSDSIYFLVSCLTLFYLQDFLFPFLFRHIIVSMKNDPISVPTPLNL